MIGYFRAMIASVDTSLLEAWEDLVHPKDVATPRTDPTPIEYDLAGDPPALRARIRGELQALVRDLAARNYADAATRLHPDAPTQLDAARLEAALADVLRRVATIRLRPARPSGAPQRDRARRSRAAGTCARCSSTSATRASSSLDLVVDLREETNPAHPLLRLERIGE